MALILYEKKEGIAKIKLNRPEVLNALNRQLKLELADCLGKAINDSEVKVVILCGAGRAFCVGEDLKRVMEVWRDLKAGKLTPWELAETEVEPDIELTRLMRNDKKVIIAAIHGWTIGGGSALAIICDLIVAADDTKFSFPEARAGMCITGGITQLLPAIIGLNKAREWLFTNEPVDVQEAYRLGLVNKVVPLGQEEEAAEEMAKTIMSRAWSSITMHKRLINSAINAGLEAALNFEKTALVGPITSGDAEEGIQAFVEKREPRFK